MNKKIEQKQNEAKSNAKKSAKDFMSSSSSSDAEEEQESKPSAKKNIDSLLKKRKNGEASKSSNLQDRMHGATVVPEPAYLKLKKLLKK